MKKSHQAISILLILLFSCTNNVKLIYKTKTPYGKLKFYSEKLSKTKDSVDRIYASLDRSGYKIYYSFYSNSILKRMETEKQTYYNVFFGKLPENYDGNTYVKFSSLDTTILGKGDMLIDSLRYNNLKKSKGTEAFSTEIVYYHRWPKNKKFKP